MATNVVASRPPKCWPTGTTTAGTPHAHANCPFIVVALLVYGWLVIGMARGSLGRLCDLGETVLESELASLKVASYFDRFPLQSAVV